jgi:O-antigen/teichoic acid export membrane protein
MLHRNLVANYAGFAVRGLMGVAFIPFYIARLGPESYALIGIYALLQVWLGVLDVGMRPALAREMARYTAGAIDTNSVRTLLRSAEAVTTATGTLAALLIWGASAWLAQAWLSPRDLSPEVVKQAIGVMGLVVGLRFVEGLYGSSLLGLQMQVQDNLVSTTLAIARYGGAAVVMLAGHATIQAFFYWQALCSVAAIAVYALVVYRRLPSTGRVTRPSLSRLRAIGAFAAGSVAISFLALLVTSLDRVMLTRILSLENFAWYAMASTVAMQIYAAATPIATAFYPRFTELVAQNSDEQLRRAYHQAAQYVSVVVGSVSATVIAFGPQILMVWTGDPRLTGQVAPILQVLVIGSAMHCLNWMPFYLKLAHGWTSLSIWINVVTLAILVPALLYVAPRYGGIGTAWLWVGVNCGYLLFDAALTHRRILTTEFWPWVRRDLLIPVGAAGAVAALGRAGLPAGLGRVELAIWIVGVAALCLATSGLITPSTRATVRSGFRAVKLRLS